MGIAVMQASCEGILVCSRCVNATQAEPKEVLERIAGTWRWFRIQIVGKYLGIHLGPQAGEKSWHRAQAKWQERCRGIARRARPVGALAMLCRQTALTILGSIVLSTAGKFDMERHLLAHMLHLLGSAWLRHGHLDV